MLRIYYFCTINHSCSGLFRNASTVVICFEFIIFALSITAHLNIFYYLDKLWFASNLLFLHYQSQHRENMDKSKERCDLLRIYYFCTINHSLFNWGKHSWIVVICFEFIIFALSITASKAEGGGLPPLWFASNLLFLHYQSQLYDWRSSGSWCCDLLRIYYFCTINHSKYKNRFVRTWVVICFEFIIFALSITAQIWVYTLNVLLWFASNLLFLHYQSQRRYASPLPRICCDLLRIYYFCTINHSNIRWTVEINAVVICFEFIIFALSITAHQIIFFSLNWLWFASNLLFLHYQSQQDLYKYCKKYCCDLLRIYYFCTINHSLFQK